MNGGYDLPNFTLIFGGAALLILAPFTALIIWIIKRAKQLPDNEGKHHDHHADD
ncbi:MAG: hypothetical protein R3B67_03045 [Phycisphaerales bacterium]